MGFSELLGLTSLNEKQKDYVKTIRESCEALLSLINDILDISKIEAGRITLTNAQFDLDELFIETLKMFEPRVRMGKVKIIYSYDPTLPNLFIGDAQRLRQIIINIVGNAFKFTESGTISVLVFADNKAANNYADRTTLPIVISVRDTGIGIPKEKQSSLFRPFSQIDTSYARRYSGSGLGLYICKGILDIMGGTISANSDAGKGSEFIIRVSLVIPPTPFDMKSDKYSREQIADITAQDRQDRMDRIKNKKILVVEDNEVNQKLLNAALLPLGIIIDTAVNGEEAIAKVTVNDYYAVLMDIQMPGMDGIAATRFIRNEIKRDVPIIGITAVAMRESRDEAIAAGIDHIILKPIDIKTLLDTLLSIK